MLGTLGSGSIERDGTPAGSGPRHVGGILVLYHRPIAPLFRDASTVVEHAFSFRRHSRLGVVELNTHAGLPPALQDVTFDAVILHYSLFGMAATMLDDDFLDYLRRTEAYKVAFFQDEYIGCQRRFAFLNEYGIDCVYTCLEPHQFDAVYGTYTSVPTMRHHADRLRQRRPAARRRALRQARRAAHGGRRLSRPPAPAYLGRGGQEKDEIGRRFRELAPGTGLRLDIKGNEADRLYGDAWHRFVANCRASLGVESGASAFDLEGEVMAEYRELLARGVTPDASTT